MGYRKLDMPVFDRNYPGVWILRVERYFAFYRLTEEEMLKGVVVATEGTPFVSTSGSINDDLLECGQI